MNTSQPQLNSLPERDLELLSAYLDNQLNAAERDSLDRRLGAEPRLRAELEELRATAALLRDVEPLRLPRSFTLNPATAPRPRRILPLAWAMQLGGGLAGLALVLLASLQMVGGAGGGMAAAPAPPSAMMQVAEATAAPSATENPAAASMAAPESAPAATSAPAAAMQAPASPEATANAEIARESGIASEAAPSDSGASDPYTGSAGGVADAAPTPEIAASDSSSPGTGSLESPMEATSAKSAPQTGLSAGLTFGLGVVLLAIALGSFLYTRSRR